jgi:type II secretory pathway component HofQ
MAAFKIGQSIVTKVPVVVVDAGLKPGTHRFQLIVENDQGVRSVPVVMSVAIGTLVPVVPTPHTPRRRRSRRSVNDAAS